MKRFLKVVGILVGALVAIVAVTVVTLIVLSNRRQAARYDVDCPSVTLPTGDEALAEGRRLYVTRGCGDCHGEDGAGKVMMDAPPGLLVGTNLTELATRYSDQDFARAIRHGVAKDGRPLLMMPSAEFWEMSDRDLGMILAYVRSLPRVENDLPASELRPLGNVLHVAGLFPALSAETIDHDAPRPAEVPIGPTPEYGRYLTVGCTGCHGEHFSGGSIPGAPPEMGVPANLTPHATGLAEWSLDDFKRAMREGKRPDGRSLNAEQMPYPVFAHLTDVELEAMYRFLRTVPARPAGER